MKQTDTVLHKRLKKPLLRWRIEVFFVRPQWGIKHIKHLNARAGNMPNTSIASLGDAVKRTNKGINYIYIYIQKNSRAQWKSLIRGRTALGSKPSKDQYVCHSCTKMLKGWGFASSPNNAQMSPLQVHESILFIAYWISYHFLISYVRTSVFPFTSLQLCRFVKLSVAERRFSGAVITCALVVLMVCQFVPTYRLARTWDETIL